MSSLRYKTRRYLKKHHWILPFMGAAVVFATFVIKEKLGEEWQATASEIDRAEELYESRRENQESEKRLDDMSYLLKNMEDTANHRQASFTAQRVKRSEQYLKEIKDSLVDTRGLLKRLKNVAAEYAELKKFEDQLPQASSVASHLGYAIYEKKRVTEPVGWNDWSYEPKGGKAIDDKFLEYPADDTLGEQADWFFVSVRDLGGDVEDLNSRVLSLAEKLRSTNQTRSERASIVTLILFVLGWALGILGKLYGMPEAASGE